jgi:NAD(P)-dependent dehydrogenase (short-subunit alcohol dehydrogenase family)
LSETTKDNNSSGDPNSILITGASGGIGRFLVSELSKSGWKVIATDHPNKLIENDLLNDVYAFIKQDLAGLLTDPSQKNNFIEKIKGCCKTFPLKAIINNAAIQNIKLFEDLTDEDWLQSLNVNLLAPISISRSLMDILEKNNGSIINISSIHSSLTKKGFSSYATTKAALTGLTKSLSVEIGNKIRVNAIEPAAIETTLLMEGFNNNKLAIEKLKKLHPTNSIGSPEDIYNAVVFLLDPSNKFLNGCILSLTGGIHNCLHDPK